MPASCQKRTSGNISRKAAELAEKEQYIVVMLAKASIHLSAWYSL